MKKCKGCGVVLQYEDENKIGYVKNDSFDYCQRCFRLTHYGEIKYLKKNIKDNIELIEYYKMVQDALYVIVFDIFDALIIDKDNLLDYFLDKKALILINKIDLLPKNITEEKIETIFKNILKKYEHYSNLEFVLTYKGDYTFNKLFFEILKESGYKKAVFVGRANAGKSTIINKLTRNQDLTTSIYPGTTYDFNEINFEDYKFIDSAGLIDEESILKYLDNEKIKKVLPLKTIKAQVFQFYERQSYFVEGLIRIDTLSNGNGSIVFMLNNNIEVHRCKYENGDNYFNKHQNEFDLKVLPWKINTYNIDNYQTFIIKGLGLIKIRGNLKVNIYLNDKIKIYKNEVDL